MKQDAPKASPDVNLKMTSAESGKETYSSNPRATQTLAKAAPPEPVAPPEEEEDDASVPVEPGTKCRRNGCKHAFVSDAVSRVEGGDESECRYHPLPVSQTRSCLEFVSQRLISRFSEKEARFLYSCSFDYI